MKCDVKTMLKAGIWLAALVAGAYLVFPGARGWLLGMSPFLFFLLCPLMMIFMMKSMHSHHTDNGIKKNEPIPIPEAVRVGESPRSMDHSRVI